MASKINVIYGPFVFSSGYVPHTIQGPLKDAYVVEHQIPASEGGIIEYVGSKQATYQIKGFLTASNDTQGGPAGAILSGSGFTAVNSDTARDYLTALRVSGAQLLRIESVGTLMSGYPILYENGFFQVKKLMFAYEPGRGYPYYPYTIDLVKQSVKSYGNSSGIGTFIGVGSPTGGLSGYIIAWEQMSGAGLPNGEMVIALGVQVNSVASGNMKAAVYSSGGVTLQAQSASQAVSSGWNYFPLSPSFVTTSGTEYMFAVKGDSTTTSGYVINQAGQIGSTSGRASYQSGIVYSADFPSPLVFGTLAFVSGNNINTVMVV